MAAVRLGRGSVAVEGMVLARHCDGSRRPSLPCRILSRRGGSVFAGIVVAGLGGCAGVAAPVHEDALFGEVYGDVVRYHVTSTRPDQLSLAALGALHGIDPGLKVDAADGEIVLHVGDALQRFPAPRPDDSTGWGKLTGRVIDAARAASPTLAAVPPDIADEMLIDGALVTLDRCSRYVRPEIAHERRAERDGFVGVGVTLDFHDDRVSVASVLPDTPAAAAGVHVADRIVAVDGASLAALPPAIIRDRLRGPADTMVTLEIARGGGNLTLALKRTVIVQPTVSLTTTNGIAWLAVRGFNQRTAATAARLLHAADRAKDARLRGVVLDLRGNPGGLLDQSIDLASLFLSDATISSTVGRVPESFQSFPAAAEDGADTLPLAVLIDGNSASASEIVAAALQDSGRAVVIGSASYGKGTVQTVLRTENGGELTVTWAELLTPRGYHLNHHGVVPTVCSDGLADGSAAVAQPALAGAREALDNAGWSALRLRCPPQRARRDVDEAVAKRLLADPALYKSALIVRPEPQPQTAEMRPAR